jgi:hypothetical protein
MAGAAVGETAQRLVENLAQLQQEVEAWEAKSLAKHRACELVALDENNASWMNCISAAAPETKGEVSYTHAHTHPPTHTHAHTQPRAHAHTHTTAHARTHPHNHDLRALPRSLFSL